MLRLRHIKRDYTNIFIWKIFKSTDKVTIEISNAHAYGRSMKSGERTSSEFAYRVQYRIYMRAGILVDREM
jgi:hypothetical protein